MASPKLAPGEHILVNVTATMRAMLFPTLELLLITGLGWMVIGYFDRIPTYDELGVQTGLTLSVQGRNMLVVAWMVLGFLRFVLPLAACGDHQPRAVACPWADNQPGHHSPGGNLQCLAARQPSDREHPRFRTHPDPQHAANKENSADHQRCHCRGAPQRCRAGWWRLRRFRWASWWASVPEPLPTIALINAPGVCRYS